MINEKNNDTTTTEELERAATTTAADVDESMDVLDETIPPGAENNNHDDDDDDIDDYLTAADVDAGCDDVIQPCLPKSLSNTSLTWRILEKKMNFRPTTTATTANTQ